MKGKFCTPPIEMMLMMHPPPFRPRMPAKARRLYEYACHEANYSLPNVLRGARYGERQGTRNGPE